MEPLAIIAAATIPIAIVYSWRRKAPLSLTFAVAMLLTFILGYVADQISPARGFAFVLDLAVYRTTLFHSGPVAYVTTIFLHAGLTHLLFNLLFLVFFGPLLEERIGSLRWGVLFLVGGIVATLAFELIRFSLSIYLLLGASGALSAIFGAFGRLYPRERIRLFIPLPLPPLPVIYYVIGFIVIEFLLAVTGTAAGIAWEAHVAGVAFGFAAAPLVMKIPSRVRAATPRDFQVLRPLVTRHELDEIYGHLSREPMREVQDAWLEQFARKAACPECAKPLAWDRGALRSECGWKMRLG